MRIERVEFFYLSMPVIENVGDGSQDAVLVRVEAGGQTGWGECEAAPLPTIAALVCPPSHSACRPVQESVVGAKLESPSDIANIHAAVRRNSLDLLQADHALSGIDMALWDLLGRARGEPVYKLLGDKRAYPKLPYASVLFGETPQETLAKAQGIRKEKYRAAKFGWGPFGKSTAQFDRDQIHAAREGLGSDGILLVDAGTVWEDNVERAAQVLEALNVVNATWLEEPFVSGALSAYKKLSALSGRVKLAGGEGCHNFHMAAQMIDYAGLGYVQIDAGRIGGISAARQAAEYARERGVTYVNHTFTSHLALSASLQAYAGFERDEICEYPVESKPLAQELTAGRIERRADGTISVPDSPGLGLVPDLKALQKYLVDVEIKVHGKTLYKTPPLKA